MPNLHASTVTQNYVMQSSLTTKNFKKLSVVVISKQFTEISQTLEKKFILNLQSWKFFRKFTQIFALSELRILSVPCTNVLARIGEIIQMPLEILRPTRCSSRQFLNSSRSWQSCGDTFYTDIRSPYFLCSGNSV